MPFADRGPVRMYYEGRGRGPAVLLVMGLGMTLSAWWRTVPVLAASFRVIAFDNRGVGRSTASSLPYTVAQMADDAIAVLDAAGEDSAHVYGISLGGMVAQEVALRHPDRVRALVLGATTPGGTRSVAPREPALSFFARAAAMGAEETAWASVPFLYSERTRRRHADRIAADIARRVRFPVDARAYSQQVAAAVAYSASARLPQIAAPTLVVHGEEDELVPPDNGRILSGAIPGAELRLLPRSAHLYVTDELRADRDIARFLLANSPRQRRAVAAPPVRATRRRRRASAFALGARRLLRALRPGRFPVVRYERLTVEQVLPRLDGLSAAELRRVAERERAGRERKTILDSIDRRLG